MARMSLNDVTICGQVCNTPELRFTKNDVPVTNFTIKTVDRWKSSDTQESKSNIKYHKIVCWGNTAKRAVNLIQKGDTALVKGELSYHEYNNTMTKDGVTFEYKTNNTEIKAINFQVNFGKDHIMNENVEDYESDEKTED